MTLPGVVWYSAGFVLLCLAAGLLLYRWRKARVKAEAKPVLELSTIPASPPVQPQAEPTPTVVISPEPKMSAEELAALDALIKRLKDMAPNSEYNDRQGGRFTVYKVFGATDTYVVVCDTRDRLLQVERYVCLTGKRTKGLYKAPAPVPRAWAKSNNPDTDGMNRLEVADIAALSAQLAAGNVYRPE